LQVRVGIATGLVVVGDLIGSGEAQERGIVGETPNLAARLQALAEPDTVVIDRNTHRLLGYLFEYRSLGPLHIKGFTDPLVIRQVTRVSAVDSRFEALRTTTTPLVGRDEEIELLMRRWRQRGNDGSVVLISGEPGIGKSRIVQSVLERIQSEQHVRLRYFCSPHHQDTALYPLIRQLERTVKFRREDTPEQRLGKLEAVLALATNDLDEVVPLAAEMLSVQTGGRYSPLTLSPQQKKRRLLGALLAQIEGLAAQRPVLIVFEDVQWIDASSRNLLDMLVERVTALRVLLIVTFRSEFMPPWVGRPHVTFLSLSRLPTKQRAEMILQVTGGKALPKEIVGQLIDRTDGVPLFIEELTKSVVESGVLVDTGDRYTVTGLVTQLAIPPSLHASLLARLDRLAPIREVAQISAALGRSFSHELISAIAPMPQPQLDEVLAQFVNTELIFQSGSPPDAEYTFRHALVQDAAYDTLLRSRRQQLHGRIAAILEERFPEIIESQPDVLARHCAEAGLIEKAVGYWLKAGQQAMGRSALTEAVAQVRKGLDSLATVPNGPWHQQQELGLQIALATALAGTKGYSAPDVGETIAKARALAEQIDRPEHLVPLLWGQWLFHCARSEHKLALLLAEHIERIGRVRNDVRAKLRGRAMRGETYLLLGEFVTARELLEQCHGLGDPKHRGGGGLVDPFPAMLARLATATTFLGYLDQGRARIKEALSEARQLKHAPTLAVVLQFANSVDSMTSSPELQQCSGELMALSIEHGFPLFLGWATVHRGRSLTALGRAQEGHSQLKEGLSMVRTTGTVVGTPGILILLAAVCATIDRPIEGLNYLAEAAEIIETTEERVSEAALHRVRGELLDATGNQTAAEQSYHQALAVARRQSAKVWELRAATSLARFWRDQGKRTEAGDLLAPIYGWFTEGLDTPVLQDAKAHLDELA
jgi:tetratricopeptide (TPR) repeat protein